MNFCGWLKIFKRKNANNEDADGELEGQEDSDGKSSVFPANGSRCGDKNVSNAAKHKAKVRSAKNSGQPKQQQQEAEQDLSKGEDEAGNPRNKTALKPGHSLMDWIRLGNSGADLTGTGGKVRPVSHSELEQHNKPEDAWMAIRGKVYNVTKYLDFHPGGVDELMRGAGKDATKLFDEVHAWVNYESLLAKCYIGPLRNTGMLNLGGDLAKSNSPPSFFKPPTPVSPVTGPKVLSATSIVSSSSDESSSRLLPVVPRFDWIQKTAEVSFIFYTRALCNPAVVVESVSNQEFIVRIYLEGSVLHRYKFQVSNILQWPCSVRQSLETGKVEVVFNKLLLGLWTSYGEMEYERRENHEMELNEYDVATRLEITHDSCALLLRPKNNSILQVTPIGHHVTLTGSIGGEFVSRSYTPVPANAIPTNCPATFIPLLVKTYHTGRLSEYLTRPVPLATGLQLSQPSGNFTLAKLKHHNRVALLTAGSGLTPMLAVLNYLLERSSNRVEHISLLYYNKTEADIWCREMLDNLADKDRRLSVRHFLSEPESRGSPSSSSSPAKLMQGAEITTTATPTLAAEPENVTPSSAPPRLLERGRISLEVAEQLTNLDSPQYATYICVCGPKPFNELCYQYLEQTGHNMAHLHSFQG